MTAKESLVPSPVPSGSRFLQFPFLQYVICCLQCGFLLKKPPRFGLWLPAMFPFPSPGCFHNKIPFSFCVWCDTGTAQSGAGSVPWAAERAARGPPALTKKAGTPTGQHQHLLPRLRLCVCKRGSGWLDPAAVPCLGSSAQSSACFFLAFVSSRSPDYYPQPHLATGLTLAKQNRMKEL